MRERKEGKWNRGQKGSMTLTLRQMRLEILEGASLWAYSPPRAVCVCV